MFDQCLVQMDLACVIEMARNKRHLLAATRSAVAVLVELSLPRPYVQEMSTGMLEMLDRAMGRLLDSNSALGNACTGCVSARRDQRPFRRILITEPQRAAPLYPGSGSRPLTRPLSIIPSR